jgi:hypothetical protein
MADATNVIAGPGLLYVAPLGSTLPTLDVASGEYPVVWPAAWKNVGYTDAGIDMVYTPSVKDLNVDEEIAAVGKILTGEKAVLSAALAEATLENLNRAISASLFVDDSVANFTKILKVGSGVLNYVMVGVQGPAPGTNLTRVIIFFKAIAQSAVSMKIQRKDKVLIPVSFDGLADSARTAGDRLFRFYDLTAGAH